MHTCTLRGLIRWCLVAGFLMLSAPISQAACSFSVTNLDFGAVNLLGAGNRDSAATVNISCTNTDILSLTYRICLNLNAGGGGPAVSSARTLSNGTSTITYGLFQDAARTTPWGSATATALGTPPQVNLLVLPGATLTATRTIYGRISGPQPSSLGGLHTSLFSGVLGANFTYAPLALATACSAITQNPTRPQFTVQATVDRTCNVLAQALNFGSHGVLKSVVDATSSISVICSTGLPYSVALNNGQTGTSPEQRRLTRLDRFITYGLYRNAERTLPWGTSAAQTIGSIGTGTAQPYPVFGRIQAQNTPPAGIYNDTVVVTVTY